MDHDFRIIHVDDTDFFRSLIKTTFGTQFRIESYASGEECLDGMAQSNANGERPGLFLLDLDLPGMNGYALCQRLREVFPSAAIPVIFVSGIDDMGARMEAFDAGAVDFLVKPVNIHELRRKIEVVGRINAEHRYLGEQVRNSETLASLVLSSLDEYGALVNFLRELNLCQTLRSVADQMRRLLRAFRLDAAIQVRTSSDRLTVSDNGENCPLEVDILDHSRNLGRIFEFKTRAAYNFDRISIVIKNVPVQDQDQCGRLRDHVAIAAEAADARLQSIITHDAHARARESVGVLLQDLQRTVEIFKNRYAAARFAGSSLTLDMHNELVSAFAFLGMSDIQESKILSIIDVKAYRLAEIYNFSGQTQEALHEIETRLADVLNPASGDSISLDSPGERPAEGGVELF